MNLSPRQALAFWTLLFTGKEPTMSEFTKKLGLAPKIKGTEERQQLIDAGLIELEKRGRANYVLLTDKAWRVAVDNFDAAISQSKFAADVLQALLKRLQDYMQGADVTLAEIMRPTRGDEESDSSHLVDLEGRIRTAYLKVSNNKWNVRVRLANLRQQLADIPRPVIDNQLLKMQKDERLLLYPLDYRPDITPEDQEAALNIGGYDNHLLYMEGE